ncbi:hypothetical protein F0562_005575 [Nyssa sinensis]|uniref:Uncharacterized protein n=1 Tax=Nyssa sinensis TaxID=561372 RepID=A0A5J5AP03_9ASTE|nr:hypothetical protein F0562_005575 [Nyssa sinensis]
MVLILIGQLSELTELSVYANSFSGDLPAELGNQISCRSSKSPSRLCCPLFLNQRDRDLHMACFDFARVIGAVMNYEIVPNEKINSVDIDYIKRRWGGTSDLVNVFPESMRRTRSPKLKAALSSAYIRIAKSCSPHIWKPESLIYLLYSSKAFSALIDCFRIALFILGSDIIEGGTTSDDCMGLSTSSDHGYKSVRVGEKRPSLDPDTFKTKRQKVDEESNANFQDANKLAYKST